jgi:hypothetical protein
MGAGDSGRANGRLEVPVTDGLGTRTVDLGFRAPPRMQAYAAPPIRITEELPARRDTQPQPDVHIFDFGQNFGKAGTTSGQRCFTFSRRYSRRPRSRKARVTKVKHVP